MVGCQGHGPGQGLCHLPQVGLLRCHHCGPLTRTHLPPALIWGGGALPDEHLPGSPGNYPPLTVDCVESIAGSDYKKKQFKDKNSHVFWGRLECGLILSSISPWDVVTKESGVTRGGYVCRHCKGF